MRSRQRNEGDLSPFDACDVREKIHLGVPAKEKSVRGVVKEIWAALSRSIIEIPTPCRTDIYLRSAGAIQIVQIRTLARWIAAGVHSELTCVDAARWGAPSAPQLPLIASHNVQHAACASR